MAQEPKYKIVMGNGREVSAELNNPLWKPILMSTTVGAAPTAQVQVTVILERVTP